MQHADPMTLAALARRADPDRYLCALFAPAAARPALFGLIAFNHELARAREATRQPVAALIRLQWWRDTLAEVAAGAPPRRHEVAAPLHALIVAGALDAATLGRLVDAREAETEPEGIPTRAAFGAYLRATAGGMALAAAEVVGVVESAWAPLSRIGAWYGLAGVLRSLPAHAAQGRCLLPGEALSELGLSAESVVANPGVAAGLVAALAAEGQAALAAEMAALGVAPPGAAVVTLQAVLARRDLVRLAAGAPVPARRLGDRLAVMWAGLGETSKNARFL